MSSVVALKNPANLVYCVLVDRGVYGLGVCRVVISWSLSPWEIFVLQRCWGSSFFRPGPALWVAVGVYWGRGGYPRAFGACSLDGSPARNFLTRLSSSSLAAVAWFSLSLLRFSIKSPGSGPSSIPIRMRSLLSQFRADMSPLREVLGYRFGGRWDQLARVQTLQHLSRWGQDPADLRRG